MYFYKLGYWTYDGAAAIELVHAEAFDTEAFERLVFEATAGVVTRESKQKSHLPFSWIYEQVAMELVMTRGFKRITFTAEFEVFGSGSVLDPEEELPDLDKLYQYLRQAGLAP